MRNRRFPGAGRNRFARRNLFSRSRGRPSLPPMNRAAAKLQINVKRARTPGFSLFRGALGGLALRGPLVRGYEGPRSPGNGATGVRRRNNSDSGDAEQKSFLGEGSF